MSVAGQITTGGGCHRRVGCWEIDTGASLIHSIHPKLLEGRVCGSSTEYSCSKCEISEQHSERRVLEKLRE